MSSQYYCANCGNIGAVSVPYPEVSNATQNLPYLPFEDYPLTPLLAETSTQTADQNWVTQPGPQRELQSDPPQVGNVFLPVAPSKSMLTEPLWPVHVAELTPLPASHQTLTDPFPQQLEQCNPVDTAYLFQKAGHVVPSNAARLELPAEGNDGYPVFTKPFSELLQGFDAIAEATKFVNKSVEQRRWEAKIAGKVKRPTNSFILYRSTYLGALHGVASTKVSRILAKSWAMECDSVRQSFGEISNVDKSLHAQAFPHYKYLPTRSSKNRKIKSRNKSAAFKRAEVSQRPGGMLQSQ